MAATDMSRRRCVFCIVLVLIVLSCITDVSHELDASPPDPPPHHKAFQRAENSSFVVVDETAITKALWVSGYKIMSLFMRQNLRKYVPYATRSDWLYQWASRLDCQHEEAEWRNEGNEDLLKLIEAYNTSIPPTRLYNNKTITIFVPPDEAIPFEHEIRAECQVITSKIDQHSFESILREGDVLPTRAYLDHVVVTGTVAPSIANVTITEWDIYNDGNVIVHGVKDFFPCERKRIPGYWYDPENYWQQY